MNQTENFVVYDKIIDQFVLSSIWLGKIPWHLEKNLNGFLEELNQIRNVKFLCFSKFITITILIIFILEILIIIFT